MPTKMFLTCVSDWRTLANWRERVYMQLKAVRKISMIRKQDRKFKGGDRVLLLLPMEHNKLMSNGKDHMKSRK